jgi:choline dehydrogenase-like flavoprotein
MTIDTLIEGGGSAGCVLAVRLSADPGRRVLLVEAGADYPEPASAPELVRLAYGGVAVLDQLVRVIDGSIMPDSIRANTHATILALAWLMGGRMAAGG